MTADTADDRLRPTILIAHPGAELYGSDRVMLESVDAFLERDWRVVVTVPSGGLLVDELMTRGVNVRLCPTPTLRRSYLRGLGPLKLLLHALRSVRPAIRLLRASRPAVVYVSTLTIPLWLLLARILRLPVICHVHEAEASAPRVVRTALALPLVLADRIAVNSRFSLGVLTAVLPRLGERSAVIYNGVVGPPVDPPPLRPVIDGPVRLLYLGRLSERKGVLDLIDVVTGIDAEGTPVELDVVGAVFPGYEWVERELSRRSSAAGVSERVHLHGFDPDIWSHLARADVLLVPSRTDEPFGNTAVEGVLAARPVIATSSGGLVEAIEGSHASVNVQPGRTAEMVAAVRQIVGDWDRIRQQAPLDAARAARRHEPATYRAAIADEVAALLPRAPMRRGSA